MQPKNRKYRSLVKRAKFGARHIALARACEIAGTQEALAEAISKFRGVPCAQSTLWGWLNLRSKGTPAEWCAAIEAVTGISKEELRPDIFGPREPHSRTLKGTGEAPPSVPASEETEAV